ncbi:MAG: endolytic transglycosylase MltG [Pseudomonadota bacterium]|nr:endolytic transglycosylase MltG [Pseudomonadota bacterium]
MTRRRRARAAPAGRRKFHLRGIGPWVLAAVAVIVLAGLWTYAGPGPSAGRGGATDVVLPPGASLPQIAADLSRAHVIDSAAVFVFAAKLTGAARLLKAGEYEFASHTPMSKVLIALREGRVVRRFVTVPEGVTSQVVADILRRDPYLTGAVTPPPEGSILPETYEIRRGEARAEVLGQMMDAQKALVAALWRDRARTLPYQAPMQAVILASVVEKETAKPDERPRIAAVFINRLKAGMRLESDPTVIYGLTGGVPLGHGLRVSELASQSPYNTYANSGLPPTPIGNPGRAALAAALDPTPTDDLYFVADGTGGHVFSDTYRTHLRNVARWRTIERTRATARAQ